MKLGGGGGVFVNAGLLTLMCAAIYWRTGATLGWASIACILLVLGFALFDKHLLNVWPILRAFTSAFQDTVEIIFVDQSSGAPKEGTEVQVFSEDWGWLTGSCQTLGSPGVKGGPMSRSSVKML